MKDDFFNAWLREADALYDPVKIVRCPDCGVRSEMRYLRLRYASEDLGHGVTDRIDYLCPNCAGTALQSVVVWDE